MRTRFYVVGALTLIAVGACAALAVQQRQLVQLRQTREELLNGTADAATDASESYDARNTNESGAISPEILELRGEISRLIQRKQELQQAQSENAQLRSQLAARTNHAAQSGFVPGYIRKKAAQRVGLGRPEDTLQTFLWALAHRDLTNASMTFTPEFAAKMTPGFSASSETDALIGMGVASRTNLPDGRVLLEVQIAPGVPSGKVVFRQTDGEWKIDEFR